MPSGRRGVPPDRGVAVQRLRVPEQVLGVEVRAREAPAWRYAARYAHGGDVNRKTALSGGRASGRRRVVRIVTTSARDGNPRRNVETGGSLNSPGIHHERYHLRLSLSLRKCSKPRGNDLPVVADVPFLEQVDGSPTRCRRRKVSPHIEHGSWLRLDREPCQRSRDRAELRRLYRRPGRASPA